MTTRHDDPARGRAGDDGSGHGLVWGIKHSFLQYVRRMPDGRGSLGDGATALQGDTFLFPLTSPSVTAGPDGARMWSFRGEVRFSAHMGMLLVRVAAPTITLLGDRAELTVDGPPANPGAERVPLVSMDLRPHPAPDDLEMWLGTDVQLTRAGAAMFDDVYAVGERFEQVGLVLPAG